MHRTKWTDEDNKFLTENCTHLSYEKISEKLQGRTLIAIRKQMRKLGIVKGSWHLPEKEIVLPQPSITQAAYIAGHFDGEGCIMLCSDASRFKLRIAVQCCHKPVLEVYMHYFGGSLTKSGGANKQKWRWTLSGYYNGLNFIQTVLPYSLEKKDQLETALNYIVQRIEASVTQPSQDIKRLATLTAHKLKVLKKIEFKD
jgi:hypothetical protein